MLTAVYQDRKQNHGRLRLHIRKGVCVCVDLYYHNVTFLLKHQYEKYIYEILVETYLYL